MGAKKPSKRVVQFLFTSRHTVPTSIPSSNYSPNLRRSCVKLPHILSRMPHSPSGASASPSPHVSIKSLELNALHTSQIQDMVHLYGNRSNGRGLEVGVGSGLNFSRYCKQVEIVFGIDPSPRLLAIARRPPSAA